MMKFVTESSIRCTARLGTLLEFGSIPDAILETPLVLLHTKRGCVPHLTKDVLKMVTTDHQILSVSLPSTLNMLPAIQQSKLSFAEFVGMKEYPSFLTIHDPAETNVPGHSQKNAISVWSKQGRSSFNVARYMELVEGFRPDMYVALCDGNTDEGSAKKRVEKSLEKSKIQFLKCYEHHQKSEALKNTVMLGPVEGGYDLIARELSVKYLSDKNLEGYVIDGLHANGPSVKDIPFQTIKNVIEHTLNLLPAEKMKVSLGCWSPAVIVELVDLGVDIFDTSYPFVMTESWKALNIICDTSYSPSNDQECVISIDEQRYSDDFTPLSDSCNCLTCKNHTKAYVKHLCQTKELLSYVLLMIHNTHQYLQLFKAIRHHLKEGTYQEFKTKICNKFNAS